MPPCSTSRGRVIATMRVGRWSSINRARLRMTTVHRARRSDDRPARHRRHSDLGRAQVASKELAPASTNRFRRLTVHRGRRLLRPAIFGTECSRWLRLPGQDRQVWSRGSGGLSAQSWSPPQLGERASPPGPKGVSVGASKISESVGRNTAGRDQQRSRENQSSTHGRGKKKTRRGGSRIRPQGA